MRCPVWAVSGPIRRAVEMSQQQVQNGLGSNIMAIQEASAFLLSCLSIPSSI